jgi:PAS domain S-box-containing protein
MGASAERRGLSPSRQRAGTAEPGAPAAVDPDALLGALFLRSPLGMAVYDATGRLVAVNEAFTRLTGVAAADVPPGYSLLTDGELHRIGVLPHVQRAFDGETVTLPPMRYGTAGHAGADGSAWLRAHLHPLRDVRGEVAHVLMTHEDVTVHLLDRDAPLGRPGGADATAGRERSALLAVMSHELRTPLNAIMGYTELLHAGVGGGSLTTAQEAHLERIRHASRQLGQLIDTVLAYARLEAGDLSVTRENVDVSAVVAETVEAMAPMAEVRQLALLLDLPGAIHLETDGVKVRQILANLLSNALKFTDHGTIRVSVGERDGVVLVTVADTGIGIRDEDVTAVFEPFTQVDSTLTRRVDGAGLGLALAAGLARLLGGRITVDSRVGMGSTFTLCLPRLRAPGPLD